MRLFSQGFIQWRKMHGFFLLFLILTPLLSLFLVFTLLDNRPAALNEISDHVMLTTQVANLNKKPRVIFLAVQTKPTAGWCRMLLSSFLSNVSVISIGYGKKYKHIYRPQWILNYINREGLREDDIVLVFDGGDTLFTGAQKIQEALAEFIASTAPTAETFDAAAVRRGEALSPMLFSSESFCYAPQLGLVIRKGPKPHYRRCLWLYARMWKAAAMTQNRRLAQQKKKEYRFLTSGGYIGRVWALRAATLAYTRLLETRRNWWCDQSIWTLLYVWSVSQVPGIPTEHRIPFGFIDLDYNKKFFYSPSKGVFTVPAIFHFPGPIERWEPFFSQVINHTSWINDIYYSHQFLRSVRCRILSEAFVKVQDGNGYTHAYRYGNVCPAKDALKPSWLASALPK